MTGQYLWCHFYGGPKSSCCHSSHWLGCCNGHSRSWCFSGCHAAVWGATMPLAVPRWGKCSAGILSAQVGGKESAADGVKTHVVITYGNHMLQNFFKWGLIPHWDLLTEPNTIIWERINFLPKVFKTTVYHYFFIEIFQVIESWCQQNRNDF